MFASRFIALLVAVSLSMVHSAPVQTGVQLDPLAIVEAQKRDDAATRAFTATEIKTRHQGTSGSLTPIQLKPCDGSPGQKWDVITAGKHNNQPGFALIVSSLTNACLNFDPRRTVGNQVILFSCGGRADGGGLVTDSQLFPFENGQTSLRFQPKAGNNLVCLTPIDGLLDQTVCSGGAEQAFTFASDPGVVGSGSRPTPSPSPTIVEIVGIPSNSPIQNPPFPGIKSGVKLDPAAVSEAHQRDNTATRAFSDSVIKTSDGQCLFVDPTSGDFRENLTPVQLKPCDGSPGQKWDIITAGKHNDEAGFALVVSSLTNACLNFDDRRPPGNQVILFSCGGRADGSGKVQDAQLFPFKSGQTTIILQPKQGNIDCLVPLDGLLDRATCSGADDQTFKIDGARTSSSAASSSTGSPTPPGTTPTPTLAPVSNQPSPGVKTGLKLKWNHYTRTGAPAGLRLSDDMTPSQKRDTTIRKLWPTSEQAHNLAANSTRSHAQVDGRGEQGTEKG